MVVEYVDLIKYLIMSLSIDMTWKLGEIAGDYTQVATRETYKFELR